MEIGVIILNMFSAKIYIFCINTIYSLSGGNMNVRGAALVVPSELLALVDSK